MAILQELSVAIVTPFNEDGSINYDRLDELIELFHCEHKTDSIVICKYNRRICYHDRRAYAVCKIHN